MDFSYGIIAVVGVLVAISLGFISAAPDEVPPRPPVVEVHDEVVPETVIVEPTVILLPPGSAMPSCAATDECFIPSKVTVPVGTTVTWSNTDVVAHTVTSGSAELGLTELFDTGIFMADATFEYTFEEAGTYDYFCIVHPWMVGMVDVI